MAGTTALAHVRTGRTLGAAWLVLARQLAGMEAPRPGRGIVVHVPRVRLDRPAVGTIAVRDAGELVDEWIAWERRVWDVLHSKAPPLARPGRHCQACRLACAVRS